MGTSIKPSSGNLQIPIIPDEEASVMSNPEKLQRLQTRMDRLCPPPNSAERLSGEAVSRELNGKDYSKRKFMLSDDTISMLSEDEHSGLSFGVVHSQEPAKRRRVFDTAPEVIISPQNSSPLRAVRHTQMQPVKLPPDSAPLTISDITNAHSPANLHDVHNIPTSASPGDPYSRHPVLGTSDDGAAQRAVKAHKPQKNKIGKYFRRSRAESESAHGVDSIDMDRQTSRGGESAGQPLSTPHHDAADSPTNRKYAFHSGNQNRGRASPSHRKALPECVLGSDAQQVHIAQLKAMHRDIEVLRSENVALQSQLSSERAQKSLLEQEVPKLRSEIKDLESKRNEAENRMAVESAQFQELTKERMNATASLVKGLARKECDLKNMRIQVNNQRLGIVVRQDASVTENPIEYFEPGYSFHQLQARLLEVESQKGAVEAKRKELKNSSRAAAASGVPPEPHHLLSLAANQEEMLKSKHESLVREEKAIVADRARLAVEQSQHVKDVKLKRDYDTSAYKDQRVMADRYVLMSMFGKGGFAEVHRAYDLADMKEVALKIHAVDCKVPHEQREYVRRAIREVTIQEALQHPRIVSMHHVFQINDNSFAIVMEACRGGDLQTYLSQRPNKQLPEKEAKTIVAQLFEGLAYLNRDHVVEGRGNTSTSTNRIIHYDLKPANILFDDYGMIKISDFGLSKLMDIGNGHSMELTSPGAGTLYYQPPECQMRGPEGRNPQISSKVDVWAAGVIFYEMLYGKRPFHTNISQSSIANGSLLLGATDLQFDAKPIVSSEAKDFIRRCLTYSHRSRPDALSAASDPYLRLAKDRSRRSCPITMAAPIAPPDDSNGVGIQHIAAAAAAAAAATLPSVPTFIP